MSPVDERGPFPLRDDPFDECPFCFTSLVGDPIPGHLLATGAYGAATHSRREIGVETEDYDGVIAEFCPDCLMAWSFFTGGGRLGQLGDRYAADHNDRVLRIAVLARSEFPDKMPMVESLMARRGLRPTAWMYDPVSDLICITSERDATLSAGTAPVGSADLDEAVTDLIGRQASVYVVSAGQVEDPQRPPWLHPADTWHR